MLFFTLLAVILPAKPACASTAQELLLAPYMQIWEDSNRVADAPAIMAKEYPFQPLSEFTIKNKKSVYWLKSSLPAVTGPANTIVLSFTNLTYVELYIYKAGECILHKKAGAFRKQSELADGDGRFWFSLPAGLPYDSCTLLLKVEHVKNYVPAFNFELRNSYDFFREQHAEEATELRLQGVLWIFLLYTLVSWIASNYSAYGWLFLTIFGATFYNLCPGGYFIDWFFPEAPAIGWLFNIHFVHLGMVGLYMLTVDFWKIRHHSPRLYVVCIMAVCMVIVVSIISFCINFFASNYALMNYINTATYGLHMILAGVVCVRCWPRLDSTQRYLAYGLLLFVVSCIFVSMRIILYKEQAFVNITYMSSIMIISIFFMFFTGLTKSQRRSEKEKQLALEKLNRLQEHQNTILEEKVRHQTGELNRSNMQLKHQNQELGERNEKIGILINELHHRVKNNLQLLYSMVSLQMPVVKDHASREILNSNISRIKAMILVNKRFFHLEEMQQVNLGDLTAELAADIKQIYATQRTVLVRTDFDEGIQVDSRKALYFSLVIAELLTNSFKYAFNHTNTGLIHISAIRMKEGVVCRYADNGQGPVAPTPGSTSIGLSLVKDLVRQMKGQLYEFRSPGLVYEITFPFGS